VCESSLCEKYSTTTVYAGSGETATFGNEGGVFESSPGNFYVVDDKFGVNRCWDDLCFVKSDTLSFTGAPSTTTHGQSPRMADIFGTGGRRFLYMANYIDQE
jgi:hypothetical protein